MRKKIRGEEFTHVTARELSRRTAAVLTQVENEGPVMVWRYDYAVATIHPCRENYVYRPKPAGNLGVPPEELKDSMLMHLGEGKGFDEACVLIELSPLQAAVLASLMELEGLIEGSFGIYRLTDAGRRWSTALLDGERMEAGEEPVKLEPPAEPTDVEPTDVEPTD